MADKGARAEAPTLGDLEKDTHPVPDSVVDTLRETMAAHEAETGDAQDGDQEPKQQERQDSRDRNPDGTFKSTRQEETQEQDGAPKGDKEAKPQDGDDKGDKEPVTLEPPAHWSASEHEAFRKMSPDAQKFVLDKVTAAEQAQGQGTELAKQYGEIDAIIKGKIGNETREEVWARYGMTPAVAFKQLVALSDFANRDPYNFVAMMIRDRQLDVTKFLPDQPKKQDDPYADDPVVQALRGEIGALKQELEGIKGVTSKVHSTLEERNAAEQDQYQQHLNRQIVDFATAKDEKGQLQHPYFDEVKTIAGRFLVDAIAPNLETAYEMACRAHPEVNRKIEAARSAAAARETEKAQREKAANARRTGSSVSGDPGSHQEPASTGDLRDDLRAAMGF